NRRSSIALAMGSVAALTVFLISLVGLPPTFGFIGKLMIFSALLAKGSLFMWLAVIGILTLE
ncbi:proton-conducting transporter membrane subunit, partial [Morganella morganii]|uniref:proton-conducting transporter transmembrane domain-containing protein n=1 Tax=Morganella morganii TaxID=582 RepID=UPI0019537D08